jgi:hypothetical protein
MTPRRRTRASQPIVAALAVAVAITAVARLAAATEPALHVDVESKPARAPKGAIVHVTAIVTAREDVTDVELRYDVPPCAKLLVPVDSVAVGAMRRGERRQAEFDVERTEGGVCLVRVFAFYPDDRVLVTRDGEQVEVVVTGTPSALVAPLDELKRKLKLP